ncbi:MAG TPA: phosphate ABC transporter substrate-binding protein PstS [Fimbriimonadaceae bacterium]|nr:phosphate ABC transporter substrate-binding protein PstS [Fimbriimonadaceae bacterium]HRJ33278.1 phosphate ABC transporter substrate-binding protein PstS [Fimbriimonadaceae bacterium]
MMQKTSWIVLAGLTLGILGLAGCGPKDSASTGETGSGTGAPTTGGKEMSGSIDARGSTFVMLFLSRAFDEFKKQEGFQINYTGGGSSTGIQDVSEGIALFGASDAPMSDEEQAAAKTKILNLPLVLGNVAVVYNVPGMESGLMLDPTVLSEIFRLKITQWNDPKIAALNPGKTLPDSKIIVQVRADGSGTTYVFSDFLSKTDPTWKSEMGTSKKLNWPSGVSAWPKSDGVATNAKKTPGSIAYLEVSWAKQSGLSTAMVKNAAGKFVGPEPAGATAAADAMVAQMPADFRQSIVNAPGDASYPIASYVFGLIPEDLATKPQGDKVLKAFEFLIGPAQAYAEELDYAKLPPSVVEKVKAQLAQVATKK